MRQIKIFFTFFTFLLFIYFINSNLEISNLTIKKENSSLFFDEKVIVSKIEFSQKSFTLYDSIFPFYFKNENNSMTNFSSSLSFNNLDYEYNISSLLGCLDENATNYNFFSLLNSDICEYEEETVDIEFLNVKEGDTLNLNGEYFNLSAKLSKDISEIFYFDGEGWEKLNIENNTLENVSLKVLNKDENEYIFSYKFINGSTASKKLSLNMNLLPAKISNLNLINNSIYNLTNKILNLSFDSSRAIKELSYFVNGKKLDLNYILLNDSIKHIESEIHILEYGNVEFILSIKDNFDIKKNVSLNFDVEFSGSLDDVDNDGILDAFDFIIGNEKDVLTNSKNLKINLTNYSNDPNLDKIKILTFNDGNKTFLRKRYNFSSKKLYTQDIIYLKYTINGLDTFILGGLKKESNVLEKTFFFDVSNSSSFTGICVVDKNVLSISEVNSNCSKQGEYFFPIEEFKQNKTQIKDHITIFFDEVLNIYEISGTINSAYSQICNENMNYTNWINNNNGYESRILYDVNNCGFTNNKTEFRQINNNNVESSSSGGGSSSNSNNKKEDSEFLQKSKILNYNFDFDVFVEDEKAVFDKNIYSGDKKIKLKNENFILSFTYNFKEELDLRKLNLKHQKNSNGNYLAFSNLGNELKHISLKLLKFENYGICLSLIENYEIGDFSLDCSKKNEIFISSCDYYKYENFNCFEEKEFILLENIYFSKIFLMNTTGKNLTDKNTNLLSKKIDEETSQKTKFNLNGINPFYLLLGGIFIIVFFSFIFFFEFIKIKRIEKLVPKIRKDEEHTKETRVPILFKHKGNLKYRKKHSKEFSTSLEKDKELEKKLERKN